MRSFRLSRREQILLIIAVVLGIFLPSVFAELSVVDDVGMVEIIRNYTSLSLKEVFFPSAQNVGYFRPLIGLLFLVDRDLFAFDPVWMHLLTVLLHLGNALMVYFLSRRFFRLVESDDANSSTVPLLAALLFGLHPLTTESANWIGGRTDPLAGLFVLMSAICLLAWKEKQRPLLLAGAGVSLFAATLGKETAIAFGAAAPLLLLAPRSSHAHPTHHTGLKKVLLPIALLIVAAGGFFLLRGLAAESNSWPIRLTIRIILNDPMYTLFTVLRAFGFYMKKLFFPWPLNAAINEADPLYELLAIPILAVCILALRRPTLATAFFFTAILMFLPSFVIAFNQVAWTTYAERYVYISLAFLIPAVLHFCRQRWPRCAAPPLAILLAGLALMIFSGSTLHRNFTWQTNMALITDTAKKSPWNRQIQIVYGGLLAYRGRYEEAHRVLSWAQGLPRVGYDESADLSMAGLLVLMQREAEAEATLKKILTRTEGKSEKALEGLVDLERTRLHRTPSPKSTVFSSLEDYSLRLLEKKKDPLLLYQLAKDALSAGDRQKSLDYFQKSAVALPPDHAYAAFARRQADLLLQESRAMP